MNTTWRGEPLWRELVGRVLRRRRQDRGEKISDTARRAGVSSQYLSELERGLKDPSSEILSAVVGALDMTLADLSHEVHIRLRFSQVPSSTATQRPLALAA